MPTDDLLSLPMNGAQLALLDKLCAREGKGRDAALEEIFARGVYATLLASPENVSSTPAPRATTKRRARRANPDTI
jgi:hypothetical protein